ncbi:replicative DNA helicase [Thiomonas sp. CB2]|nr:replicative DNA helicase [Thiomonas sp. CB2]VDY06556.1 replicative DNA helicase [Thiomonas sp. Bio17B3]VDY10149.1 replicative DNA helicase [Thiomonas sp. Sup16B3]VDY15994.1 replicative DNA helicase [Thiomonas sp. CB2]
MPPTAMQDQALDAIRTPPHSIEAEQSVLGGLLLDNQAFDKVADLLVAAQFYRFEHRAIFQAIADLINLSKPADVITVLEALQSIGKHEECGGLPYLNSLAQCVPSAANIRRYAEIVRERAVLRQLVTISDEIAQNALNPQGRGVQQILDEAESRIFAISEEGAKSAAGFQSMKGLLGELLKRVSELAERGGADTTGVPTGFADLDRMTAGLQPGDLVIVAGRPSMGKTAFSLNIAEHVAINEQLPVAVFSMEMGASQLVLRVVGSMGRIDQSHLRTGQLSEDEWTRLPETIERLQDVHMHIDETPALNPLELRARSRRLARQFGGRLGLIVVDYLQLMSSSRDGENRATEISEISRSLKALAKELHCPVIALSQLNRDLEKRTDKRPVMSDLRESGAIEQDADVILFIYRDEVYNKDSKDAGVAEVIIGKQRNGPIGVVHLAFLKPLTRFENLTREF